MKRPSNHVRVLVVMLSVIVVVLSYSGVEIPELVHNLLADVLVIYFLT